MLVKFVILITTEQFYCPQKLSIEPISTLRKHSLAHEDRRSLNNSFSRKKKENFINNIAKSILKF